MKTRPFIAHIFLLMAISTGLRAEAQNPAMYKSVKIDTTKVISKTELVKIANRVFNRFNLQMVDAKERLLAEQQFTRLQNAKEDQLFVAQGLSSAAIVMAGIGASKNIPITLTSKTASLFAGDTLIVNNFGAILRLADSIKTSLPVLLYAKSLYPNSPVILTNLANTLFELYDDHSAEYFYNRALKINPNYTLASQGLVSVYLKRKDLRKAIEQLFKSVTGIYCRSMKTVHQKIKDQSKYSPPDDIPDFDQNPTDGQSGSGTNSKPIDLLRLIPFPDWPEPGSLIADKSMDPYAKQLTETLSSLDKYLNNPNLTYNRTTGKFEMKDDEDGKAKVPGKILYTGQSFAMNLLEEYYKDRLKEIGKTFHKADSLNTKNYTRSMKEISDLYLKKLTENPNPIDQQQYMQQRCRELTELTSEYFNKWKAYARVRHNAFNDMLSTYWIYCEPYLNKTYDPAEFKKLNDKRKSFIKASYIGLYAEYMFKQVSLAVANQGAFASVTGKCPDKPRYIPPASNGGELNVPDKDAPDCPTGDKKMKLGLLFVTLGIDCSKSEVELEAGEGIILGTKWNYKNKELSAFAGAGFKAEFGLEGGPNAEVSGKGGFEITFDKDQQVTDVSYKTEVGASSSFGGSEVGKTLEMKISGATGLNVERTTELTAGKF